MIKFTKMHGAGNDFVMLDGVRQHIELSPEQLRLLADRHFGVGCDQILIVEKTEKTEADFRYRIFNSDGGEVEQKRKVMSPRVETELREKGSELHAACVVGDTVGDPFKDTAGPSLHVLIKLLSTITLVLAPLFIL